MKTRRLRIACWIPKATDTLKIFNTYCFSTATMVRQARFNVTSIRTLLALLSSVLLQGTFSSFWDVVRRQYFDTPFRTQCCITYVSVVSKP
jgi:hypothetical protein